MKFKIISLFLALMLIPVVATALGIKNPSVDPRASGMAGAAKVDTKSPAIIYFNPAGLSYMNHVDMSFGANFLLPKNTHTGATAETTGYSFYAVPDFYLGWKPREMSMAFGLAMNMPYGTGVDWGETGFARYDVTKATLNMFNIQPTVSFLFTKHFSLGIGMSMYVGTLDFRRKGMGALPGEEFDIRFKGTGFQQTLNLGAIYKPIDSLTLGISFKTGKTMKLSGDVTMTDIPASLGLGVTEASSDGSTYLTIPPELSWGVAWDIRKNLKIEFDMEWLKWSEFRTQAFNVDSFPTYSQVIVRNWEDSFTYAVGAEWFVKEWLGLRTGYCFNEISIPDSTYEASIPDADKHVVSFGAGFKYKKYLMNLAYEMIFSKANAVSNAYVFMDGTYDAIAIVVSLGLQYNF